LRMRLIGSIGLLIVAAAIFASPGKTRLAHTSPPPMPGLRGEAAAEYLQHQGLHSSLAEAVKAARHGVYPSAPRRGEKRAESFYAGNTAQRWRAGFTPEGLTLRGGEAAGARWEFGMNLRSAGYGKRQMAVGAGRLNVKGSRIEYERTVESNELGAGAAGQSGEPDNCRDDGNTTNDIVIASDCRSVQLRAERAETGDGRVYTVILRLRDNRGNVTRREFEVSAPIVRNGVPAVKGPTALTVTSSCQ
jgi:hypothetical protein